MSKLTTSTEARMQHPNARLTPTGRLELVRLVEERGFTFEQAAACSNVAKSTAWEWVRRWRRASAAERRSLACLRDRSSRPSSSPGMLSSAEQGADLCRPPAQRLGAAPDRLRARPPALHGPRDAAAPRTLAPAASPARGRRPLRVALPRRSAAHRHQALRTLQPPRSRRHRRSLPLERGEAPGARPRVGPLTRR